MEQLELSRNFSKAFEAWKKGQSIDLNQAIRFAMSNGIDLTLKMPKSVLDKTATTRPMSRRDAIEFSNGTEGDLILFNIPSELNKGKIQYIKRFELIAVNDYRDGGPSLLIRSRFAGIFGVLRPNEVASLELK